MAATAAVVGHCWPLYTGFQGGMGLGSASFILLYLSPVSFLLLVPAFVVWYLAFRHRYRAAAATALTAPVALWITGSPIPRRILLGRRVKEPQIEHMRFANGSEVYIRAAYHTADAVRGIDADYLMVDEYQDIASGDLPILEETLSHSEHRRVLLTGTPKSVDNHLEDAFNRSTAYEWRVPCSCSLSVFLDDKCQYFTFRG